MLLSLLLLLLLMLLLLMLLLIVADVVAAVVAGGDGNGVHGNSHCKTSDAIRKNSNEELFKKSSYH